MIGKFKNIPRRDGLKYFDPGGHLIEVEIKVNGITLYDRTFTFEEGRGNSYRYRTDTGQKVTRGRNASIKSMIKNFL